MSKTNYILDTSTGRDGVFLFDGEVKTSVQVLNRLSELQAELERLRSIIKCTAEQAAFQVNKL